MWRKIILVLGFGLVTCASWLVDRSLSAERNHIAISMAYELIESHVRKTGTWPDSWEAFRESTPTLQRGHLKWPENKLELQSSVEVDFDLDVVGVANDRSVALSAVRANGVSYGVPEAWANRLAKSAKDVLAKQ